MALTVKQLIKELKKWPQDYRVGVAAHDLGSDELDGHVQYIDELEEGFMKEDCGPTVVLRS